MTQKTLIFIKPDAVDRADEIFKILDRFGAREKTVRIDSTPRDVMENHYSPHRDKFFFEYVVGEFVDQPIVLALYTGDDVISKMKTVIGVTDPAMAGTETIRGQFSDDSLEIAVAEKRGVRNAIHRSDSPEEFEREFAVWKKYFS
ncbi:hypothetical protein HN954_04445 [bacterium]|nr:hypothetical protein [bacterium]MBT6996649.1 hypothetical protein [bacterium]